ncbi:MAG: rRNA maturation RNase YbeY [Candidatus Dormibacteria bacterium]
MSLSVNIQSRFRPLPLRVVIRRALKAAADEAGVGGQRSVGVLVCDDDEIRAFNLRFAGVDAPTDVLSFPAEVLVPGHSPQGEELGDLVLSLDHVQAQAAAAGHPIDLEIATLVIHGFLHLLGHDHADSAEEERMFSRTARVLENLGMDPGAAWAAGHHVRD